MTDDFPSYRGIGDDFEGGHAVIKHSAGEYVQGDVSINIAESYSTPFKRGIHGAFHHVSGKHLPLYCEDSRFQWGPKKATDEERTEAAIRGAEGKRLMYRHSS